MKWRYAFLLLASFCSLATVGAAAEKGANGDGQVVDQAQVQQLQEKMLGDSDVMALIFALQNDPEMKALLNDPEVLTAVQAGDVEALKKMPRFMQLLNNQRVEEIRKRIDH